MPQSPLIPFTAAAICSLLLASGLAAQEQQNFGSQPAELYIRSYDGAYVGAALRKPPGTGPFPAVLFIHGGYGGSDLDGMKQFTQDPVPEHFFRLGYAVMSTDYRRYHFGEDEIQDVTAAYRRLEAMPFVDKRRIAVIGGSHGGYLAKMLAMRVPAAAVVSFAGLTDIEGMYYELAKTLRGSIRTPDEWFQSLLAKGAARTEAFRQNRGKAPKQPVQQPVEPAAEGGPSRSETPLELAGRLGDNREWYRWISPLANVGKVSCPVLFLVGSKDRLRPAGKQFIDALRARGAPAEYSEHPDMGHGFYWGLMPNAVEEYQRALKVTTAFVERYTKK